MVCIAGEWILVGTSVDSRFGVSQIGRTLQPEEPDVRLYECFFRHPHILWPRILLFATIVIIPAMICTITNTLIYRHVRCFIEPRPKVQTQQRMRAIEDGSAGVTSFYSDTW